MWWEFGRAVRVLRNRTRVGRVVHLKSWLPIPRCCRHNVCAFVRIVNNPAGRWSRLACLIAVYSNYLFACNRSHSPLAISNRGVWRVGCRL